MKLILAIVNDDDAATVSGALTKAKISATKLATTGATQGRKHDLHNRC